CLPGHGLGDTRQLEHHTAGLDVRDPPLRRALTGTHTGLGRLLREGTVREDVDPHLAAAADVPGHGDTRGLDLAVGHVSVLKRLDAVIAEHHAGAALGHSATARPVLLAVLDLARDQHGQLPPAPGCSAGPLSGAAWAAASVFGARSPRLAPPRRGRSLPPPRRGRSPRRSWRWLARALAAARASRSARLVGTSPL